jgi:hypothetical protein
MLAVASTVSAQDRQCRQISADVVAFDQAFYNNRFGTLQQGGMMFALRRDVVPVGGSGELRPGYVTLRPGKRPRPMVLRMNVGDCLTVRFTNLLRPTPVGPLGTRLSQSGTRAAGVHVMGMEPIAPNGDGSWAGANANSLIPPGASTTYGFFAEAEGAYLLYSTAADVGTQWNYGGQLRRDCSDR